MTRTRDDGRRPALRVLIVEDDDDMARLAQIRVANLGHTIAAVWTRGFGGLLEPGPWGGVDVALVDVILPGDVSGQDILRWLGENEPSVARVAHSAVALVLRAELDGLADVVLSKPCGEREIEGALARVGRRDR